MAGQTLYDILQVSRTASADTIRASWERLSAQWDPVRPYNNDAEARTHYLAIKNAYATLGDPRKRAIYDRTLSTARRAPVRDSTNSLAKLGFTLLVAVTIGAYYYIDRGEVSQLAGTLIAGVSTITHQKQSETSVHGPIAHVAQTHAAPIGDSAHPHDRPGPSETLPLKLDTEFSSGKRLSATPLTQL